MLNSIRKVVCVSFFIFMFTKMANSEVTKKTLKDFGYGFNSEGKLRQLDVESGEITDLPFVFEVSSSRAENQRHYEALGDAITEYVYELMDKNGMHRIYLPENQPEPKATFIFSSKKELKDVDKLMVIIHGSGVVRAGQWARSLIINHSLDSGSILPYIKKAQEQGYEIVVTNTNDNHRDGKIIQDSGSPDEHAKTVWRKIVQPANAKSIAVVAHSYGGHISNVLSKMFKEDFDSKVFAVALTDSVHGGGALLELLNVNKFINVVEDYNIISHENVPEYNTILIEDSSVQFKHAAIAHDGRGLYRIIDLCTKETRIKISGDSTYELLDPLKFYNLNHGDKIKFGNVETKFLSDENAVLNTLQIQNFNSSRLVLQKEKKTFFVPETQVTEDFHNNNYNGETEIFLPETEIYSELSKCSRSPSQESVLEIISENVEKSKDPLSQNLFADISIATKTSELNTIDEDDGMNTPKLVSPSKESKKCELVEDSDENSLTPDLDSSSSPKNIKNEKKAFIFDKLQANSSKVNDFLVQKKKNQSADNDETQYYNDSSTDDERAEVKVKENLFEQTQPLFILRRTTRKHEKEQQAIKPKTVSLKEFEELESKTKVSNKFSLETQPIFLQNSNSKMSSVTKTKNRILLSSSEEEDTKKEISGSIIAGVVIQKKAEVQNILETENSTGECWSPTLRSPPSSDSLLIKDMTTPEYLPKLPSDSQFDEFLELVNNTGESDLSYFDDTMRSDENIADDKENCFEHKEEKLTSVNETERAAKRKKIRRRIMKYISSSDDDDDGPSTSKIQKTASTKSVKSKPSLKARKSNSKILQSNSDDTRKELPKRSATPKKQISISLSNITSANQKAKYHGIGENLGCKLVKSVIDADILLTTSYTKTTSKILAALCKGIPIVTEQFLIASKEAGKLLNPYDYFIPDQKVAGEHLSFKDFIFTSKNHKRFTNTSVYVTSKCVIPYLETKEIIEAGDGEIITDLKQEPKKQNFIFIHNIIDEKEIKFLSNKYPSGTKIRDVHFFKSIVRPNYS
ncbi:CLUMA_CG015132, isoform A [Clunio marinus]|uniref:CLUMA_CG015132, isoform A n=1 Tax=Clunio marinus TaxID=568069 RepID=A0A1J1ITI6_9DIPT|nr:CLUMA_CG015132, isoform A [Clunio marinus]